MIVCLSSCIHYISERRTTNEEFHKMRVFARTSITEYVGSSISRFVYHCEFVAFHLLCTCTICIDYKSKNSIWCVRIYIYTNMQTCLHQVKMSFFSVSVAHHFRFLSAYMKSLVKLVTVLKWLHIFLCRCKLMRVLLRVSVTVYFCTQVILTCGCWKQNDVLFSASKI